MSPAHFDFEIGRYETLEMTFALHRLRHDLFVPSAEVVAAVAAAGDGRLWCSAWDWLLREDGRVGADRGELRAAGGAKF